MDIEWDPAKAASDFLKHGISFSEVESVFYDEFALAMPDPFTVGEKDIFWWEPTRQDALSRPHTRIAVILCV